MALKFANARSNAVAISRHETEVAITYSYYRPRPEGSPKTSPKTLKSRTASKKSDKNLQYVNI